MPFALVASLGALAVGVLMYLLIQGVVYLIRAVAAQLPNFDIFFIPVHLGDWFKAAADPVASWLVGVGSTFVSVIEGWLRGIPYLLMGLFQDVLGVFGLHAEQISHLNNVAVPLAQLEAINAAERNATMQVRSVRDQVHAAQVKWENAHSYADATNYIDAERAAPSVENADLALVGRTLIAAENHAQDLHDQLKAYVDVQIAGVAGTIDARIETRVQPIEGAIAIPTGTSIPNIDVQDLIKTGAKVAVGTAVAVIAEKIVQCLVSNCAGNNNFQNLLQDALGLVSLAEFAEFVEALVNNPAGTLTQYTNEVGQVFSGGEKGLSDVWGDIESVLGL